MIWFPFRFAGVLRTVYQSELFHTREEKRRRTSCASLLKTPNPARSSCRTVVRGLFIPGARCEVFDSPLRLYATAHCRISAVINVHRLHDSQDAENDPYGVAGPCLKSSDNLIGGKIWSQRALIVCQGTRQTTGWRLPILAWDYRNLLGILKICLRTTKSFAKSHRVNPVLDK